MVKRSGTTGSSESSHRTPAGVLDGVLKCEIFFSLCLVRRPYRGAKAITTGVRWFRFATPPANIQLRLRRKTEKFGTSF